MENGLGSPHLGTKSTHHSLQVGGSREALPLTSSVGEDADLEKLLPKLKSEDYGQRCERADCKGRMASWGKTGTKEGQSDIVG